MRPRPRPTLAALAAAAIAAPAWAGPAGSMERCAGVAVEGPDVEAVRRQELRGARMNVDGWDEKDARSFFAPDIVSIQPGGAVSDLAAIMRTFAGGRVAPWARSFDLTSLDIRVFGCSTAIVVGTSEARPLAAAPDAPPWRVRFLNVWRKENGRWLYWANQFTTINDKPAAARPSQGQ